MTLSKVAISEMILSPQLTLTYIHQIFYPSHPFDMYQSSKTGMSGKIWQPMNTLQTESNLWIQPIAQRMLPRYKG